MIIVGIDPGIATLGYGVIEKDERGRCHAVDYGVVVTPKEESLPVRLALLEKGVEEILQKYQPEEVAMEELFFSKNITTGIAVAQARGVALLTCVKACGRLYEYTPMQVKQALTGYGRADKKQMQEVVTATLRLDKIPKPDDAADALAIALCHASTSRFGELFAVGNMTRRKGKNVAPLLQEELKKKSAPSQQSKKERISSVDSAKILQNATGLSDITGIGRAAATRAKSTYTKSTSGIGKQETIGAGTRIIQKTKVTPSIPAAKLPKKTEE